MSLGPTRGRCLYSPGEITLAWLAGIERTYVGALDREPYSASLDMIEKLAQVLGIDPMELPVS